jgi:hypothetical protein
MRTIKRVLPFLLLVVFLLPLVSSEIKISQPQPLYNLGDSFDFEIITSPKIDASGFLVANLVCGAREIEIYKAPASVLQGEQKSFIISGRFDKFLVGDLSGICLIKSNFAGEQASSQTFELSNEIRLTLEISGFVFDPGESINISGSAYKRNGNPLNGNVEIRFGNSNESSQAKVRDGSFATQLIVPYRSAAGDYDLSIIAFDEDSNGNRINEGITNERVKVRQIQDGLEIAVESETILPGTELIYTIILTDQTGGEIKKDLEINIYDPKGEDVKKDIVKTSIANRFQTQTNHTSGYWKITATSKDLKQERTFYLEEIEKADFTLKENTLSIYNVGNVKYDKAIKIKIGNFEEIINVDLKVGEKKQFRIEAPDGQYKIEVDDGNEISPLGQTFLTGNAINIDSIGAFGGKIMIWIWIIVILVLIVISFYLYRIIRKRKQFTGIKPKSFMPIKIKDKNEEDRQTMGTVINRGEKQDSAIVSLNIKNLSEIKPGSKSLSSIDSALWRAKESGAKVYADRNYRVVVLSPALTKEKDNSIKSIMIAQDLERSLKVHNKHSKEKIEFGIGVNIGHLIVEKKDNKFKFVSIGSTISTAKKLSHQAINQALLSEAIHRKTAGKIKTERVSDNSWSIKKIIDRAEHTDFVNKFLHRQK